MLFRRTDRCWMAQAPAKVNLYLRVVSRRPDGYHDLETVMALIDLHDTLYFEPTPEPDLALQVRAAYPRSLAAPPIPTSSENLVLRAAAALQRAAGCQQGVRITLHKRIPAAAGLGGGSSDAATTLSALNQLWGLGLDRAQLMELAAQLGSDVPFFLAGSAWGLCTGRGEIVEPLRAPACLHLVLTKPVSGLSTAAVYQRCQPGEPGSAARDLVRELQAGRWAPAAHHLRNDLQPPAESLNDDVAQLRHRWDALPVWGHQLTGSGSAYFGVCRSRRQAQTVARWWQAQGLPWACTVTTRA